MANGPPTVESLTDPFILTFTPAPVIGRLSEAAIGAMRSAEVQAALQRPGFDVGAGSPEEFARFLQDDMRWQLDIMKRIGLQPQ